ncbi:MAG: hypothetical protein R3A10_07475 [Caldilineaceae bacterium]
MPARRDRSSAWRTSATSKASLDPTWAIPVVHLPSLRAGAEIAARLFADLELLEPDAAPAPVVKMNWPFHGGMILRNYWAARTTGRPVRRQTRPRQLAPGIMIEINRGLFVGDQTADTPEAPPDLARLDEVRSRLYQWTMEMVALLA